MFTRKKRQARKKGWKWHPYWMGMFTILLLSIQVRTVLAAPTKEYYQAASDFFVQNSIINSVFRSLGWMFVKGLYYLCYGCEYLYSKSFELLDFTTWGKLGTWIDTFRPVWIALMCLSLAALGVMMVVTHRKQAKLLQNVVLAVFIVTSSSIVLTSLNQVIISGKRAVFETKGAASLQVIQDNMYSLVDLDRKIGLANLTNENATTIEHLTENDVKLLNPAQTQNYNSENLTTAEAKGENGILAHRLEVRGDGAYDIGKVKNGYGWNTQDNDDFGNEFYYRFKFNWFSIYTEYLSLIIVFLCLAYKVTRIVYEITFGRILAYCYSAELSGGQKAVKILCGIRDNYIVLLFTMVLVKVFMFASEYITGMFQESGMKNMIAKGFFLLFLAFCTIDGPNLIEKVTGVDAGLSSGFGKIMALKSAATGIAHSQMAAGRKIKNLGMALATGKSSMERKGEGTFSERMAKGVHNTLKKIGKKEVNNQENHAFQLEQNKRKLPDMNRGSIKMDSVLQHKQDQQRKNQNKQNQEKQNKLMTLIMENETAKSH